MAENHPIENRIEQIEGLIEEMDQLAEPALRDRLHQLVQTIMQFHGDGLQRIVEKLSESTGGDALMRSLAEEELVHSLLLLYGLHPVSLETRVMGALEKVRPLLASHGGDVELLGIEEGVARLRLNGSCHGCPSSAQTLKNTIEEAIYESAADLVGLEVLGVAEQPSPTAGFVPLAAISLES